MPNTDQALDNVTGSPTRLPPMAYVLTSCVAVIGSNSLGLGPIAPEVALSLGSSVQAVMTAAAAFGLGTAASALFLARYIDRIGARRMLQLALALLAASLVVSAVSPIVAVLIAGQLIAGIASGIALPAIYASAAAIAPPGRESRTIGVVLTGWTLSMVVGVALSAVLADLVHWRAVFAAIAALALAGIALLSISKHRDVLATEAAPLPLEALKITGTKPLLIACGAFMAAFYGMYGYLGDYLHNGLGQPVSANGLAALVYGLGFGAAALLDSIVDRVGVKRVMPAAFLGTGTVYVSMAMLDGSFTALLIVVFLGTREPFRAQRADHALERDRSVTARHHHGIEQRRHVSRGLCRNDCFRSSPRGLWFRDVGPGRGGADADRRARGSVATPRSRHAQFQR